MTLDESRLQQIVGSIVAVSKPAAILLFGSYARGDFRQESDVDLLVIRDHDFRKGESRRKELGLLYRAVSQCCDTPKDIILLTKAEFLSWKETTNHIAAAALREGRVIYGQI
jgi:uncharacterized protein